MSLHNVLMFVAAVGLFIAIALVKEVISRVLTCVMTTLCGTLAAYTLITLLMTKVAIIKTYVMAGIGLGAVVGLIAGILICSLLKNDILRFGATILVSVLTYIFYSKVFDEGTVQQLLQLFNWLKDSGKAALNEAGKVGK